MRVRSFAFAAVLAAVPSTLLGTSCSGDTPPPPVQPPKDSGWHPDYYVPPVDGPAMCEAGLMMCAGMCVDVMGSDPMNCGACNKACPMDATCSAGHCSTEPAVAAAGAFSSFVALYDGTLYAWGGNESQELATDPGTFTSQCASVSCRYQASVVAGVTNAKSVAAGFNHACAAQSDGKLLCWGGNDEGQLGHSGGDQTCGGGDAGATYACNWTPQQVTLPSKAVDVAAGKGFTCARLDTKDVYCWGTNAGSVTGRSAGGFDATPSKVGVFTGDVEEISVAGPTNATHACARRTDGSVWCWGKNDYGQLGAASPSTSATPLQVTGVGQAAHVALAEGTSCVLRANGDLLCWGSHARGGLGNATAVDTGVHATPGTPNVRWGTTAAMFAGLGTHWAKDTGGNWWTWGVNLYGTFGDGTMTGGTCGSDVCNPNTKQVSGLFSYRWVTAADHALGISPGGRLASWGRNDYGQLGRQPGGTDSVCPGNVYCNPTPSIVQGLP